MTPAKEPEAAAPPAPSVLLRLARYAGRHRGLVAGSIGVLVVVGGLDLWVPDLVRRAIDGPIRQGDAAGLAHAAMVLAFAVLLGALARGVQQYVTVLTGQRVGMSLRQDVFGHLQRMGLSFFDTPPRGHAGHARDERRRGRRGVLLERRRRGLLRPPEAPPRARLARVDRRPARA